MKFLIDAQIPKDISDFLKEKGYDSIHTSELTLGNKTDDSEISFISIRQKRVLISKDSDFYYSFILKNEPYKLVLVKNR
ncbi:MAG: DUF5615 family PIN-like protein [Spirochaetia bacterium]|nr:DUF5615 family PIN-like protein [Spirochaetia bacterium]